ncbi:MAG TPA: hypothetical protein VFC16_11110 [Nakamurella sp.]|nr:hypothetical protein [Nakamurella sp.]
MLHVRLLVPTDLFEQVLALIDATVGVVNSSVVNSSVVRAAGRDPAGDLVEVDAAQEIVDVLLDDLADLQLDGRGSISIEQIDLSLSRRAREAQDQAPGNATDAVIWEEAESRTGDD